MVEMVEFSYTMSERYSKCGVKYAYDRKMYCHKGRDPIVELSVVRLTIGKACGGISIRYG